MKSPHAFRLLCVSQTNIFSYLNLTQIEDDEENQKRGFVAVLFHHAKDGHPKVDFKTMKECGEALNYLPIRFSCIHVCVDNPVMSVFTRMLLVAAGPRLRKRFRIHTGSHIECKYKLMTFGIPVHLLPLKHTLEIKNAHQKQWLAKAKVKEEGGRQRIDLPTHADVLLGKGQPIQKHTGNERLRHLVQENLDTYMRKPKREKTVMTLQVMEAVKSSNGRFLEKDRAGWWIEVDDERARYKVSKAFSAAKTNSNNNKRGGLSYTEKLNQQQRQLEEMAFGASQEACYFDCKSSFSIKKIE